MRRLPVQVPLILGVQAFLFYFPSFVWKALNFNAGGEACICNLNAFECALAGINVKNVLNSAATIKKKFDKGSRSSQVQKTASHIAEALEMQRDLKTCLFTLLQFQKYANIFSQTCAQQIRQTQRHLFNASLRRYKVALRS